MYDPILVTATAYLSNNSSKLHTHMQIYGGSRSVLNSTSLVLSHAPNIGYGFRVLEYQFPIGSHSANERRYIFIDRGGDNTSCIAEADNSLIGPGIKK